MTKHASNPNPKHKKDLPPSPYREQSGDTLKVSPNVAVDNYQRQPTNQTMNTEGSQITYVVTLDNERDKFKCFLSYSPQKLWDLVVSSKRNLKEVLSQQIHEEYFGDD